MRLRLPAKLNVTADLVLFSRQTGQHVNKRTQEAEGLFSVLQSQIIDNSSQSCKFKTETDLQERHNQGKFPVALNVFKCYLPKYD